MLQNVLGRRPKGLLTRNVIAQIGMRQAPTCSWLKICGCSGATDLVSYLGGSVCFCVSKPPPADWLFVSQFCRGSPKRRIQQCTFQLHHSRSIHVFLFVFPHEQIIARRRDLHSGAFFFLAVVFHFGRFGCFWFWGITLVSGFPFWSSRAKLNWRGTGVSVWWSVGSGGAASI